MVDGSASWANVGSRMPASPKCGAVRLYEAPAPGPGSIVGALIAACMLRARFVREQGSRCETQRAGPHTVGAGRGRGSVLGVKASDGYERPGSPSDQRLDRRGLVRTQHPLARLDSQGPPREERLEPRRGLGGVRECGEQASRHRPGDVEAAELHG